MQVRHTSDDSGKAWFVLADVARLLGYSNPSVVARSIEDAHKSKRPILTKGGLQTVLTITEEGFARLIGMSRDPRLVSFA